MANTKISALTALSTSQIATGDQFVIVDVSDTTHAASGTTKKLAASGLVWTDGAQTITGAKTFSANQVFEGMVTGAHFRLRSDSIADDAVVTFVPNQNIGVAIIAASISGAVNSVIVAYRAAAVGHCTILAGGSNVTTGTVALTGTTGTDGKLNLAADSSGNFYIENRTGATQSIRTIVLA